MNLQGKVCVVTGARSGIGKAIATGFAKRQACVVATDLDIPHGVGAMQMAWDVADEAMAERVMNAVLERFGRVDVLVANAGVMPRQRWDMITPEDWRRVHGVNLDGAWYGAQAAAKRMQSQGWGKILFVSSVEVRLGVAEHCHYVAAKSGLVGLTRSLARALGNTGVRVNCLMPGAVQTESERSLFPDQATLAAELAQLQCLPHRLLPTDIEPVAAFLASAASDAITGQVICADHGLIHF